VIKNNYVDIADDASEVSKSTGTPALRIIEISHWKHVCVLLVSLPVYLYFVSLLYGLCYCGHQFRVNSCNKTVVTNTMELTIGDTRCGPKESSGGFLRCVRTVHQPSSGFVLCCSRDN
jgi:hypothetical protein